MAKAKSMKRRKKVKVTTRAKSPELAMSPKNDLANISAAALQAELRRRQRRVRALMHKHEQLMVSAAALRAEIEGLGGATTALGRLRRRPLNKMSLVDALKRVLSGKTLSVDEAVQRTMETGYRSSSPHFRLIVNRALARNAAFKRVSRGHYTGK
jgi:hypothetical protein